MGTRLGSKYVGCAAGLVSGFGTKASDSGLGLAGKGGTGHTIHKASLPDAVDIVGSELDGVDDEVLGEVAIL